MLLLRYEYFCRYIPFFIIIVYVVMETIQFHIPQKGYILKTIYIILVVQITH